MRGKPWVEINTKHCLIGGNVAKVKVLHKLSQLMSNGAGKDFLRHWFELEEFLNEDESLRAKVKRFLWGFIFMLVRCETFIIRLRAEIVPVVIGSVA